LAAQYRPEWVVYSKPPFGGPEQVLKYLARYTHRVALSNQRLRSLAGEVVTFTAKDYAAGGRQQLVRLSGEEFLRRWLAHVLPRGLVRIRHYGLLANRQREAKLAVCRWLLGVAAIVAVLAGPGQSAEEGAGSGQACPSCGVVQWWVVAELPRAALREEAIGVPVPDTS
jgi:hypothetical protein